MSEQKVDTKKEEPEEIVTPTLVVAELDPNVDADATATFEDPESATPQTSSEKLNSVDKKTFLFAGYVFWGLIFVSGGATAAVLLSRKKPEPTTVPTIAPSPSPTNQPLPTALPTAAPSYAECSHDVIMEKLALIFDDDSSYCSDYTIDDDDVSNLSGYECSIGGYGDPEAADAIVKYEFVSVSNDFNIPYTFDGWLRDDGSIPRIEFPRNREPCNFYKADELFEKILIGKTICSHEKIQGKLYAAFGETNCSTDSYVMGCELAMESGARARAEYSFSFNGDLNESQLQPEAVTMTYSEEGTDGIVVDWQLAGDVCTFYDTTSVVFDKIATKCPEELLPPTQWKTPCIVDEDLVCQVSCDTKFQCVNQRWAADIDRTGCILGWNRI